MDASIDGFKGLKEHGMGLPGGLKAVAVAKNRKSDVTHLTILAPAGGLRVTSAGLAGDVIVPRPSR
jgi:hypothetical protein